MRFTLVLLFSFFLLFWQLGNNHLTNWDEAWYSDVARTVAEEGNFFTPMWNGRPFFDKPPLFYWLSAASFKLLGVSEFAARFVPAVAGLGTVVLVYVFAGGPAAIVLSTTVGFLSRSRTGNLDSLLAFFLFLAIYSYYRLTKRRWGWVVFGLSLGAAFLTKGFIAFGFPLVIIGWSLLTKHVPQKFFWKGLALFMTVAAAWMLGSYAVNGSEFLTGFLVHQGGKVLPNGNPLATLSLDYFFYLKSGLKLWIFLLPLVFIKPTLSPLTIYPVAYILFLSFSENKSDWFLVPLYPVVAVIVGHSIGLLPKVAHRVFVPLLFVVGIANVILFRQAIFPPDVAAEEARLAQIAGNITRPEDPLYLTNYYFPTTRFYSRRVVYSLYADVGGGEGSWWILPKSEWSTIIKQKRVFILSTKEEFANLRGYLSADDFVVLAQRGEKIFLAKKTNL